MEWSDLGLRERSALVKRGRDALAIGPDSREYREWWAELEGLGFAEKVVNPPSYANSLLGFVKPHAVEVPQQAGMMGIAHGRAEMLCGNGTG